MYGTEGLVRLSSVVRESSRPRTDGYDSEAHIDVLYVAQIRLELMYRLDFAMPKAQVPW
jgi:hypothetical protein